jgi:hypothetical protein
MPIVAISDIYEGVPWADYLALMTIEKSEFVKAGIMASTPELAGIVSRGGRLFDMPYWEDLPHDADANSRSKPVTDDTTDITPDKATTEKDIAHVDYRAQSWATASVVKYPAGSDPANHIMDKRVDWWIKENQRILLMKLQGIFATTLASTHENDISVDTAAAVDADSLVSSSAIQDTRFLLGDRYSELAGMIMHSVVYKRLENLNLITFIPTSDQLKTQIPTYHGIRVFVDDGMTVTAVADTFHYDTYLFGMGAIGFAMVPFEAEDSAVALWYDPKKGTGSGQLDIITRQQSIMHPRGVKWVGTVAADYPSDAELILGASWTKVYPDKLIKICRLVTNG